MKILFLMTEPKRKRMSFVFKIVFVILLVFGLLQIIIAYNKKEKKEVEYIGNSIMEKPNLQPKDLTEKQIEYYEYLAGHDSIR